MIAFANRFSPQPSTNELANGERFERKFYLTSDAIPFAAHLLAHCCPPDPRYPRGRIHSVYYDTADLEHYQESEDGCRTRKKVRLRWYNDAPASTADVPVFVELKSRNGFAGRKQRKQDAAAPHRLTHAALRDGLLPYARLLQTLAEFDYSPRTMLHPTLLISYQRLRFVEPLTGSRVSLDWNIYSTLLAPALSRGEHPLRMDGGVIELKGRSEDLPETLRSLRLLDTDWSRYSKYATCLQSQLEDPGTVGRTTPSGRVQTH